jgi:RsiW-degrading membrane proteinase PrsW (M82 family)
LFEFYRFVGDSLFHACAAGITAYFVGLAVAYRSVARALIVVGIAVTALVHGCFDYFAIHGSTWLAIGTELVLVLVFISYVATGARIEGDLGARLQTDGT